MTYERTSWVSEIKVTSLIIGSFLEIGDSFEIYPDCQVEAVQRKYPCYSRTDLLPIDSDGLFSNPLLDACIYEPLSMTADNKNSDIKVGSLQITGASTAAFIHIGSTNRVHATAKIKNVREWNQPCDGVSESVASIHGEEVEVPAFFPEVPLSL